LWFLICREFGSFRANEKVLRWVLLVTTISTIVSVYFSGYLSDIFGRLRTLAAACIAISASLFLYGWLDKVGIGLIVASLLLGFGWGLTHTLGPIVLTRLVSADERVRFFTQLSIFVMAAFGLSPVLASFLEKSGYSVRDAFYVTAALCVVSAILFFLLDGSVKAHAINPRTEAPSRITLATLSGVLTSRALLPVIMVCIGASVFAGINNF